jgi:F0F1-type ATP synthase assembly protein I
MTKISPIVTTTQLQKPVAFKGNRQEDSQPKYISSRAASSVTLWSFLTGILGYQFLSRPGMSKILTKNASGAFQSGVIGSAFKAASPATKLIAAGVGLAGTLLPAFITTKYFLNKNQPPGQSHDNKTAMKLTGAVVGGSIAGDTIGRVLTSKMAPTSVLPLVLGAFATIIGLETATNWIVKQHNKKVPQENKPQLHVINTQEGLVVVQDFRQFLNKTQGS